MEVQRSSPGKDESVLDHLDVLRCLAINHLRIPRTCQTMRRSTTASPMASSATSDVLDVRSAEARSEVQGNENRSRTSRPQRPAANSHHRRRRSRSSLSTANLRVPARTGVLFALQESHRGGEPPRPPRANRSLRVVLFAEQAESGCLLYGCAARGDAQPSGRSSRPRSSWCRANRTSRSGPWGW